MLTQHLKAWRKSAGLTLEQVAESLGVTHSTVGKWEKGQITMSLDRLEELAQLYKADHPLELLLPPDNRENGPKLAEAIMILQRLTPQDAAAWLLIGRRMAGVVDPALKGPTTPA